MKNKIFFSFFLGVMVFLSSCSDVLEEEPKKSLFQGNLVSSYDAVASTVYGAYDKLTNSFVLGNEFNITFVTDMFTLNAGKRGGLLQYNHTASESYIYDVWVNYYDVINACNASIAITEKTQNTFDNVEILQGYARALRAYMYFSLAQIYGGVPLVTVAPTKVDIDAWKVPRNSVDEVYGFVISEFEACLKLIPQDAPVLEGVINHYALKGLLAKVYLHMASLAQRNLEENSDGTYNTLDLNQLTHSEDSVNVWYNNVIEYSGEIINSGQYELVKYFPDEFHPKYEHSNKGMIWSIKGLNKDNVGTNEGKICGIPGTSATNSSSGTGWGTAWGTTYCRSFWDETDSIRMHYSYSSAKMIADAVTIYSTESPEMWNPKWKNAAPWNQRFRPTKSRRYPVVEGYNFDNSSVDIPVLRLAEVYLMWAEAKNELDGPGAYTPTAEGGDLTWVPQSAIDAVNIVRQRARWDIDGTVTQYLSSHELSYYHENVPDWTPGYYGSDFFGNDWDDSFYGGDAKKAFRLALLNERAREFYMESNIRWTDLSRRGHMIDAYQRIITYVNTSDIHHGDSRKGNLNHDKGSPKKMAENVQGFHTLMPIPQTEIYANPKLIQNPGY